MALGLLGAVVSAAGTLASAQAQAAQASYNAKVAEINARTARQEGLFKADQLEDKYQRERAAQRVAAAASGLNYARGSPALVIGEGYRNQALDEATTIWNAETEATAYENKAKQYRMEASAARTAGMFGAGASFLTGIGNAMRTTPALTIG
jgi:hypothetical protein